MFKSYKLYKFYKKVIRKNQEELLRNFNIRIDDVNRLYTVINLPPQIDTYGPKDGPRMTAALLKTWLAKLDNFLIKIGIKELTRVETIQEIDETNYLLVIRFKLFNSEKIATYSTMIGIGVGILTVAAIFFTIVLKLLF